MKIGVMVAARSSQRMSASLSMPYSFTVGTLNVTFSQSVNTLGVTLDVHLTMITNVVNLVKTADFQLRHINSTSHYLSVDETKMRVSAFVLLRLDYCNSFLCGYPQYLINRLQKVQNNAARLILKISKTNHVTPHLQTLHRLPVDTKIRYDMCVCCCFASMLSSLLALSTLLSWMTLLLVT